MADASEAPSVKLVQDVAIDEPATLHAPEGVGSPRTAGRYGAVPTTDQTEGFLRIDDSGAVGARTAGGLTTRSKVIAGTIAGVVAVAAAVALGVTLTSSPGAGAQDGCSYTDYMLRPSAQPLSYAIYWRPQFASPFTFAGSTTIDTLVTADGQACIQVHAYNTLNFTGVAVESASAPGVLTPVTYTWNVPSTERIIIRLPAAVDAGARLKLHFNFTSPLGQDMVGLYQSTYTDDGGSTVNIVTTQFEATYARRAYPCFDEPAYKAVYNMTLDGVPAGYTALSNMPVASSVSNPDGTSLVTFQSSPKMSTYLVAAVVAPMIKVSGTAGHNNVLVSVYAVNRSDNAYQIGYALDGSMRVLEYYESVFGVDFPLPKLDMVAIPDFAAGAMENWGCITYRETALLANESTNTASELQRVTVVIAHEVAHQWFGDIVTMQWWNSLWLNEGDASLWEYLGTQAVHPEFQIVRQFQVGDMQDAMAATQYGHSRPLISTVDSSASIESQFDGVAYSFGASILYTLKNFIERSQPTAYTAGMAAYLQTFAFGNAAPDDFWAALATSANLPNLPSDMATYTDQTGYPVVTVQWVNGDGPTTGVGSLQLRQDRHFLSPYARSQAPANQLDYTWWIPLTLYGEHPDPTASPVQGAAAAATSQGGFTDAVWSTTIGGGADGKTYNLARDGYVKINGNWSGYYRVQYPMNIWNAFSTSIAAQLQANSTFSPMSPADRAQLLTDFYTFAYGQIAQSSGINMAAWLNFGTWLQWETEYEPWTVALPALAQIRQLLVADVPLTEAAPALRSQAAATQQNAQCLDDLSTYAQAMLGPIVANLGFTGVSTPLTDLLRTSVLSAASIFNVTSVVTTANAYYAGGVGNIPVNIQSPVLASAVRWAPTSQTYDEIFQLYLNEQDANVRRRYLGALAATRDRSLLTQLLSNSLNPSIIRSQDTVSVIASVAGNSFGRDLAWKFVKENWSTLNARYGSGGFSLSQLVSSTASKFTTQAYMDDINAFYTANPIPAAQLDWQQAMEAIGTNIGWEATDLAATCTWLRNYASSR